MLAKFKQFVEEILADNSRLAKIAVLEKYKDDEDIKYLLQFIYDPYIIYGVGFIWYFKRIIGIFENS